MRKTIELKIEPRIAGSPELIKQVALDSLGRSGGESNSEQLHVIVRRRSIDARSKQPKYLLRVEITDEIEVPTVGFRRRVTAVSKEKTAVIIGAGPAGYFCAMKLIELGIKPIVLDRGADVRSRRHDLRAIQQFGTVNPNSNYCFGEGGAGTYSDGKLYTRSTKRGNVESILQLLVEHGATSDILVDAHPHIGSNKLPQVVTSLRQTIEEFGGEVRFNSLVTDLVVVEGKSSRKISGVVINGNEELCAEAVVLATGHSARDIFYLLDRKKIKLIAKAFAMGVRVEHSQEVIDLSQYHQAKRDVDLPASSYRLACQVESRGVYSFCMCPGGLIVPAATAQEETVVNGMSMSRRDSPFANSGLVVEITEEDLVPFQKHGQFAGLEYQGDLERRAFIEGGDSTQRAPAQRIADFIYRKLSHDLPPSSYIPGLHSSPLHEWLPAGLSSRLHVALQQFGKKIRGYDSREAIMVGVESRTSSPVAIPRDQQSLQHPDVTGFYPCGEGAGYAGGIISASIDGERVADSIAKNFR